jgi:putative hydrolase of the HAD superfamily
MVEWAPERFIREAFADQERVPTELAQVFGSLLWAAHDGGWFSREEVIAKLPEKYDRALFKVFVSQLTNLMHPIMPMVDLFYELKTQGYKVYFLSNMPNEMYQELILRHDFFKHPDGQLISFQVGSIKPMPQIYQALLSMHQLNPEECLFIDDREDNIEAAQKLGIEGIVYKHPDQVKEELKRLLDYSSKSFQ